MADRGEVYIRINAFLGYYRRSGRGHLLAKLEPDFVGGRCNTADMNILSNSADTSYELPYSEAAQTLLRPAVLRDLGSLPFPPGALISRSLWVVFIGEGGIWTRAVLPVDDSLDMPDEENITGLCHLVGSLIRPPGCHGGEQAMVVLRRPGPPEISEADAYIFRLVRDAAVGQETAPWAFYVVGPDGVCELPAMTVRVW